MSKSKGVTQMSDDLSNLKRRYTELKIVEKIKVANWKELSEKSSLRDKEEELEKAKRDKVCPALKRKITFADMNARRP